MALQDLLHQCRDEIIREWMARIAAADPDPSSRLLANPQDRFLNPIRHAYEQALPAIYDELVGTMDRARMREALEEVMRVRALQDLSATDATSFMLLLKDVLRDALHHESDIPTAWDTWRATVGQRVDDAMMVAFDVYVSCRDKIQELRAAEARRAAQMAQAGAGGPIGPVTGPHTPSGN